MRIALVAETFSPAVNGVVNSVRRVAEALAARGHQPVVIAPTGSSWTSPAGHLIEVHTVPSVVVPGYRGMSLARPGLDLTELLESIDPDVVHLASPAVLGWSAVRAARRLDLPTVAIWQTDLPAFVRRYRLTMSSRAVWSWLRRLHNAADLTLVPSSASAHQLRREGIGPLAVWTRGVDSVQFAPAHRDQAWHDGVAGDDLLVGFVGRLAHEKRVELLEELSTTDGVTLVVVGDGPRSAALRRRMPDAVFTGQLTGAELGRAMASLDLLAHPGADETFCQVVQEALCSGVPVIAVAAGGPLDLVRHGDNGLLWDGDDTATLAAQVSALRDDRVTLAGLAARARASVVDRSWAAVTDQLLGHYGRVLARHPARQLPRAS